MNTRLDLLELVPKDGFTAELGVFAGDFSREIINRCRPSLHYMVDSFEGMIQSGDANGENGKELDMEEQWRILREQYAGNPHVSVVRSLSWDWLDSMPENSLDFCYCDTSHTIRATERELRGMWRVVKPGGLIAGHDWHPVHFPGVVMAVAEFCEKHALEKEIFRGDKLHSFLIRKPK